MSIISIVSASLLCCSVWRTWGSDK